jgi:multisubunit Na+/H+ antiporter MnhC subunit
MTNHEFHKPFIGALIVTAIVTVVSMVSSRYIVEYYMDQTLKTPIFTSQESHNSPESPQ